MQEQSSSISNFRRFLIRIVLPLILIIGAAAAVFDHFFEKEVILKNDIGGAYKVNRILKEIHPEEIPIFGSSRAQGGYIPDSLGSDYFNYGIYGTCFDVTLFFLEEECKKTKQRPWIITNIDLFGFIYGLGDISSFVYSANEPAVKQLLRNDYHEYYSIPFLKYYGVFENYFRLHLSNKTELSKLKNKGALIEKDRIAKKEFDRLVSERTGTRTEFIADTTLTKRLFTLIASHPDRIFIFCIAPYHRSYFEKFSNIPEAYVFLDRLRSYSNVKILDFGRMPLPDDMFFNTTHVNYRGAILFNEQLKDSLTAIGVR
jgi:hypothetical protein